MADFWRDYFQHGLGNKVINTLGGVLLRKKWNDLQEKYGLNQTNTPTETEQPVKTPDTMYNREQGTDKQDLNKQPVPEYQAPTMGGFKPIVSTSEEEQNQQEFGTPTPNAFINSLGNNKQTPLLTNQDKNKVDFSGIGMMVDPVRRKQYNDQLMSDVMGFMNYAQRFPELSQKYNPMIEMFVKSKQMNLPEKVDAGKEFTDKNGYLYERQYNPYTGQWLTVPVNDSEGKHIQTKLPEMRDFSKYHYYIGTNGNAWYKDENGKDVDTGINYRDWDTKYDVQMRGLDIKDEYNQYKMDNPNSRSNRSNGSSNGTGNSMDLTFTGTGDNKTPMINNVPLKREVRKIVTNKIESYTQDGQPIYKPYEETQGGYWLGDQWVSDKEMSGYADDFTKGNLFKNNLTLNRLKELGIGITPKGEMYDFKGSEWINKYWNVYMKIFKKGEKNNPRYQEAIEWLGRPENQEYAKKLGVATD